MRHNYKLLVYIFPVYWKQHQIQIQHNDTWVLVYISYCAEAIYVFLESNLLTMNLKLVTQIWLNLIAQNFGRHD